MDIKKCGSAVLSTLYDSVTTLGTRGPDGLPYAIKVVGGITQIAAGLESTHAFPAAFVAVNAALKPAIKLVGSLTTPFTDLEGVVNSVRKAKECMKKGHEDKTEVTLNVFDEMTSSKPVAVYKDKEVKSYTVSHFKTAEAVASATANSFVYVSSLATAAATLASIGATQLSDSFLNRVAVVGSACATIFAVIGSVGTITRFGVASVALIQSKDLSANEIEIRKATFKHAAANLAKTALKISLMVFAGYFSMVIQGVAALAIVSMDIYVLKTKHHLIPKTTIDVLPKLQGSFKVAVA